MIVQLYVFCMFCENLHIFATICIFFLANICNFLRKFCRFLGKFTASCGNL